MNEEILPIVDTDGNVTGKAGRNQCHTDKSLLHPVVHIHIFNRRKAFVFAPNFEYEFSLLQKDRTTIFASGESE